MARYWYSKIQEVCDRAQKDNKRITAVRIQRRHRVPYSTKTILKVMREIKKQGRPFEAMGKTTTAIEQVLSACHGTTPPVAKT